MDLRCRHGVLAVATLIAGCAQPDAPVPYVEPPRPDVEVPAGATVVSLTFDDGFETHRLGAKILDDHGLRGTFYVILSRLGREGYMTVDDLRALADRGHEIGAHTFTHRRLTELPLDEATRELCDARVALQELGFNAESFAYPFGGSNADLERIASACQYNSARGVGGLRNPETCIDCPVRETVVPARMFEVMTPPSVGPATTLETIQQYVIDVERNGGGWVPLVFHNVCDGCATNAVSPAVLTELAAWLADRGTLVATVDQIVRGETKPAVAGPAPVRAVDDGQLLVNASLETGAPSTAPDCWRFGAASDEQWSRSTDAYHGTWAQYVTAAADPVKARLLSGQDMGTCAVPAAPGERFELRARVRGSAHSVPVAYYRTRLGEWVTWTNGKTRSPSSTWTDVEWTTPRVPEDATAISVGLALVTAGDALFDDFRLRRL